MGDITCHIDIACMTADTYVARISALSRASNKSFRLPHSSKGSHTVRVYAWVVLFRSEHEEYVWSCL